MRRTQSEHFYSGLAPTSGPQLGALMSSCLTPFPFCSVDVEVLSWLPVNIAYSDSALFSKCEHFLFRFCFILPFPVCRLERDGKLMSTNVEASPAEVGRWRCFIVGCLCWKVRGQCRATREYESHDSGEEPLFHHATPEDPPAQLNADACGSPL